LVVAIDDRKYFTEVGRDLEDELPDGLVGSLQRQYLVPEFKKGNYAKGISDTIDAYIQTIRDKGNGVVSPTPEQRQTRPGTSRSGGGSSLFCCAIILLVLFLIIISRSRGGRGGGAGRRRRRFRLRPCRGSSAASVNAAGKFGSFVKRLGRLVERRLIGLGRRRRLWRFRRRRRFGRRRSRRKLVNICSSNSKHLSTILRSTHGEQSGIGDPVRSAAAGDFVPKQSDYNILIALKQIRPKDLRKAHASVREWTKLGHPLRYILLCPNCRMPVDVFPIEFNQMNVARRVLFGTDVLAE
jgi:uncharacterized membrane protein YgcG